MKPKHPLIIVLSVMVSLLIGGGSILQLLQTEVVLVDGSKEEKIISFSKNIKKLIEEQSLVLRPLDEVYPSEETPLSEGLRIVIKRFEPIVVKVDDKEILVYQRNLTAKAVLRRAGVMLGGKDQLNVSLDRVIKSGEIIEVNKEEKITITVDREIPFKSSTVASKDLDPGERLIQQFGATGTNRDYYEITKLGGQEISRVLVKTELVSQPVEQVMFVGPAYKKPSLSQMASLTGVGSPKTSSRTSVSRGTSGGSANGQSALATSSQSDLATSSQQALATSSQLMTSRSKDFAYKNSYVMIATAYDLSFASTGKMPGMPGYGLTASGTKARVGAVAVDPEVIPLGTKLYIENADGTGGYGYAVAEDKGSAIKGYRVDLFFNTYQECIDFGRRRVIVYVLE